VEAPAWLEALLWQQGLDLQEHTNEMVNKKKQTKQAVILSADCLFVLDNSSPRTHSPAQRADSSGVSGQALTGSSQPGWKQSCGAEVSIFRTCRQLTEC
jgi:hypothetical protein